MIHQAIFACFLPLLFGGSLVSAQYNSTNGTTSTNTTIQYNDLTQINYQPPYVPNDKLSSWRFEDDEGVSYTNTTGANFTVHFTGNSISLYASKKHDRFNLRIVIDGKDAGYANEHQDVGTGPIALLYQYTDLKEGPHTFVGYVDGSAANSVPDKSFVALAYLVASSGGPGASSSSKLSTTTIIGIAVGAGVGILLLLIFLTMFYIRRQRRSKVTYESPQFVSADPVVDASTVRRASQPMGQIVPLPFTDEPESSRLPAPGEHYESSTGHNQGIPYDPTHSDSFNAYPQGQTDPGYFFSPSHSSRPRHLSSYDPSQDAPNRSYTSSATPNPHSDEGVTWSPPASPQDELMGFLPSKGQDGVGSVARTRAESWGEARRLGGGQEVPDVEGLRRDVGSPPPPRYEH